MYHAYYLNGSNETIVSNSGRFARVADATPSYIEQRFAVAYCLDFGVTFTATESGIVKFKYRFTEQNESDYFTLVIGKADTMYYKNNQWNNTVAIVSENTTSTDVREISIEVEKGEKLYFLLHAIAAPTTNRAIFYFTEVEYTEVFEEVPEDYVWNMGSYYTDENNNSLVDHDSKPFNLVSYYAGANNGWNSRGLKQGEHDMFKGCDINDNPESGQYEDPAFNNGPGYYHAPMLNSSGNLLVSDTARMAKFINGNTQVFDAQTQIDVGVSFIAPVTGTVRFNYNFNRINDDAVVLIIGRASAMTCDISKVATNGCAEWKAYEDKVTADGRYAISLDVTAGEKIYFLVHSEANWTDTGRVEFNFDNVRYTKITITEGVNVAGAQDRDDGENYDVRFIASIDDYEKYEEIGFVIVADYGNGNVRTYDKHCTEVFTSLLAMENGETVEKNAIDFNGNCLMALTVDNIPVDISGTARFEVKAYYVSNGETTYTSPVYFNSKNGKLINN